MNMQKLGLKKYKFVNATGLNNADLKGKHPEGTDPNAENSMSARDMGILSKAMITKYPEMLEDTKQRFRNFPDNHPKPIRMENWNWMLPGAAFAYEGADGLKPEVLIQLDTDLLLLLNAVMYVLFRLLLKQNQWTSASQNLVS